MAHNASGSIALLNGATCKKGFFPMLLFILHLSYLWYTSIHQRVPLAWKNASQFFFLFYFDIHYIIHMSYVWPKWKIVKSNYMTSPFQIFYKDTLTVPLLRLLLWLFSCCGLLCAVVRYTTTCTWAAACIEALLVGWIGIYWPKQIEYALSCCPFSNCLLILSLYRYKTKFQYLSLRPICFHWDIVCEFVYVCM